MTIKMNWGWRILFLYLGFVLLMGLLIIGSMRQHFDLVSEDYYAQELQYQHTIDASNNQSVLSARVRVTVNDNSIRIVFPGEFRNKPVFADLHFYCPSNTAFDKRVRISTDDANVRISRNNFKDVFYRLKLKWVSDGTSYYQETDLNLSK